MPLLIELRKLDVEFKIDTSGGMLATLRVRPLLIERILAAQRVDEETKRLCKDVRSGKVKELSCDEEGILKFGNRLYVPHVDELRREIMEEAQYSKYAIHLGSTKMYRALKKNTGGKE